MRREPKALLTPCTRITFSSPGEALGRTSLVSCGSVGLVPRPPAAEGGTVAFDTRAGTSGETLEVPRPGGMHSLVAPGGGRPARSVAGEQRGVWRRRSRPHRSGRSTHRAQCGCRGGRSPARRLSESCRVSGRPCPRHPGKPSAARPPLRHPRAVSPLRCSPCGGPWHPSPHPGTDRPRRWWGRGSPDRAGQRQRVSDARPGPAHRSLKSVSSMGFQRGNPWPEVEPGNFQEGECRLPRKTTRKAALCGLVRVAD